jgi:hypothetical protein
LSHIFQWGVVVSNLEWITYVCNHCHGAGWREQLWKDSFANAPSYVKRVMAEGSKAYFINRKLISHLIHFLPMNRFQNSLWDSCHWGTTCTTNLDVWLAAQCF